VSRNEAIHAIVVLPLLSIKLGLSRLTRLTRDACKDGDDLSLRAISEAIHALQYHEKVVNLIITKSC